MAYHRNNTLDMLKLFAAYMVVFLHVPFYGTLGIAVNALARFAVPLFFMVSGFYSYGITRERIKRRIAHLIFLLVFAILICTASKLSEILLNRDFQGISQYFKEYLNFEKVLNLILFNKTIHVEYLWYLFALLYVYIIFYFTTAYGTKDRHYWVVALLTLCVHLFLGEFLSIFGIVIPNYIVRNFALMGIPFFGLGMLANKYQRKLRNVPNSWIMIFIMIGMLETLVSRWILGKNELHFGSVLILFSLAVVFIKFPDVKIPAILISMAGCNAYIYILHPIVSAVMVQMYALLGLGSGGTAYLVLRTIHPLVVCVISTIAAYILNRMLLPIESYCNAKSTHIASP